MPRGHRPVGKNADPAFRSERSRLAGQRSAAVRNSTEHHVKTVVDRAGELTAEQVDKLRSALPPEGGE